MACSPWRRILSCHHRRRIEGFANPVGSNENLRQLDISNGCRNHTLLPYAARLRQTLRRCLLADEEPYEAGFSAVRLHAAHRSRKIRPAITLRADAAASTTSQPTFVTIAIRPLPG